MPPSIQKSPAAPPVRPDILPTLFGEGYGGYQVRKSTFVLSFLLHTLVVALLLTSGIWMVQHHEEIKRSVVEILPADKDGSRSVAVG